MIQLGIIKNYQISKNKDGTHNRLLLQVEITKDDVRTIELMTQAGDDTNPAIGSRVFVADAAEGYQIGIATTDDLEPEVDSGEKELYSTDGTDKLARLKLNLDSEIELNGNADYAVSWTDLNTVLQNLVTAINQLFGTKKNEAGSVGTLTLDLSSARVDVVRLP